MAKTVLVPTDIVAKNIDAYNRTVINDADIDNGAVFQMGALSTDADKKEVFEIATPETGAGLKNLWMAYSPEVVLTVSGDFQAKGIDADPRNFTNVKGIPFDAYKIQVGDLVTMTAEGFSAPYNHEAYAVAQNGSNKLAFAGAAIEGVTYKVLGETQIVIASGNVGSNAVKAYLLECVAIA